MGAAVPGASCKSWFDSFAYACILDIANMRQPIAHSVFVLPCDVVVQLHAMVS